MYQIQKCRLQNWQSVCQPAGNVDITKSRIALQCKITDNSIIAPPNCRGISKTNCHLFDNSHGFALPVIVTLNFKSPSAAQIRKGSKGETATIFKTTETERNQCKCPWKKCICRISFLKETFLIIQSFGNFYVINITYSRPAYNFPAKILIFRLQRRVWCCYSNTSDCATRDWQFLYKHCIICHIIAKSSRL